MNVWTGAILIMVAVAVFGFAVQIFMPDDKKELKEK